MALHLNIDSLCGLNRDLPWHLHLTPTPPPPPTSERRFIFHHYGCVTGKKKLMREWERSYTTGTVWIIKSNRHQIVSSRFYALLTSANGWLSISHDNWTSHMVVDVCRPEASEYWVALQKVLVTWSQNYVR